jgi:16S rRNA (guanine527-N7)-methyltransferase
MTREELAIFARDLGIFLEPDHLHQFAIYETLLTEWNARISLTAIRDPRQIRIRHFLDSLTCTLVTGPLNSQSLIDVGSGAGFPGLPLKILYPDLRLTLVESVAKKCRFLEIVLAELGHSDVKVVTGRAEEIGHESEHRERYDWATARAVAELRVLVEYLLPFAREGGHMLAQKGESAAAEIHAAQKAIHLLGGGEAKVTPVQLPETADVHNLVVIDKCNPTDSRYPRRAGIPSKRPL